MPASVVELVQTRKEGHKIKCLQRWPARSSDVLRAPPLFSVGAGSGAGNIRNKFEQMAMADEEESRKRAEEKARRKAREEAERKAAEQKARAENERREVSFVSSLC